MLCPQPIDSMIAHRGASAYAPENTIASFEQARLMGALAIECDVMLSQDEVPFIFHDDALTRTTNGTGELGLVTADYLETLDAGHWFSDRFIQEKIPRLEAVIAWLAPLTIQMNFEVKPYPGMTTQTAKVFMTTLQQHWPKDKPLPLVSSFDFSALIQCRSLSEAMPLGLLLDAWDTDWLAKAKAISAVSIHFNYRVLTPSRIREVKAEGYFIAVYTVNHRRLARQLFHWGVDSIFTDYPDLLS